jgi:lipoprotein-anchoring transpeptidase ErfK/SrfK
MSTQLDEARLAVQKARQALRDGDRSQARRWAERAAELAPQMEDPWLVLAAVASPRASLEYVQRALKINPESDRARRGLEWAMQRLREPQQAVVPPKKPAAVQAASARRPPIAKPPAKPGSAKRPSRRGPILAILLLGLGCMVCAVAAWSASTSPVVASMLPGPRPGSEPARVSSWAQAPIPKPTYTPDAPLAQAVLELATATPEFEQTPLAAQSDLVTSYPTDFPTPQPTETAAEPPPTEAETSIPTVEPTWSGSLALDYVPDTPTSEIPTSAPPPTAAVPPPGDLANSGQHWIDVNLSQQMVYAYAGDTVMNSFLASTGTWMTPTVTGKYHIYVKLRYTDMTGPDYYLPNVPFTMYFFKGYGLHGTYWHHNFGTPMSHGCVNLSIPDAEWLYNFSSEGTLVNVHY